MYPPVPSETTLTPEIPAACAYWLTSYAITSPPVKPEKGTNSPSSDYSATDCSE
jgi:hypothetical protein